MSLYFRRVTESDWLAYKTLRMNALRLSPSSYGTKLSQVEALSDDEWKARTKRFAESADAICIMAFNEGQPAGIIAAFSNENPEMVQMWVEPSHRGLKIGEKLVSELKSWAKALGFRVITAWVGEANTPARRLYEKCGFVPTGKIEPDASKSGANDIEIHWVR